MDRAAVNPSFLKLLEHPLNVTTIREPLSTLLEGFLKNLKYNKYPSANDLPKAAIFIQNAVLIYSDNVDELFACVCELNRTLYIFKPQASSVNQSIPNYLSTPSDSSSPQDEEDEQVTASRTRKQSRRKIEEHDSDPTDIVDSWTADIIDETQEEMLSIEKNDIHIEFFSEQDLEVETVLAQCDNFESTSSFVCRDDVHKDKSKDASRREYRILAQMTDDGFICTDFNIFDTKRSKRFSSIVSSTVDLSEVADLNENINRDRISLDFSSNVHSVEINENEQEDDLPIDVNSQRRLDLSRKDNDASYYFRNFIVRTGEDQYDIPLTSLEEASRKYMRKAPCHKYALYRDFVVSDEAKLSTALEIHGITPYPIDSTGDKFYPDPNVLFEGSQNLLYHSDFFGWSCEEVLEAQKENPLEISGNEPVAEMDESDYIPDAVPIPRPSMGNVNKIFTKKASKWIELWKPIVQKTTNAKKFDINEYGDKVIESIGCNNHSESPEKAKELSRKTLEDVLRTQTFQEASKYFLAVLVLANNGNLELEKSLEPLAVNQCNITLLSQERHHEKFHQDIALHPPIIKSKKKK